MISVTALQQNNKIIYVGLLSTLTVFLLMDYIPVLAPFSRWSLHRIFISGVDICISLRTGPS